MSKYKSSYVKRHKPASTRNNFSPLQWLILIILGLILTVSPFFFGLYSDSSALIFILMIGLVTLITAITRLHHITESLDLIDIGILGLSIAYIISIPYAVDKGGALLGTVRILGYLGLYFTASRTLRPKDKGIGAWLLVATAALLTLAGIGSSVDLPRIPGGWGTSLSSTFQYRDSFGAYLMLTLPIAMLLFRDASKWWQRYLSLGLFYINILGLFGSQSRGVYVIFLIILVPALLAFRKRDWPLLLLLGVMFWTAAVNWMIIYQAANRKSLIVLLLPWAGLAVVWLSCYFFNWVSAAKNIVAKTVTGLFVIILLTTSLPLLHTSTSPTNNQIGGMNVVNTLASVNTSDSHWQERMFFYKDALKMIKNKPFLGFGANGWAAAYKGYQDYLYYSKEVHSELLTVGVESGIPGLVFYALIWFGLGFMTIKAWRNRHSDSVYLICISAVSIMAHSLIDLDLSLSALFFTLILLLAALRSDSMDTQTDYSLPHLTFKHSRFISIVMLFLGCILIFTSSTLTAGLNYAANADAALNGQQYSLAINYSKAALNYDPFQAMTYANIARIEAAAGSESKNPLLLADAQNQINQAVKLNSTEPLLRSIAAQVYAASGQNKIAYEQAKEDLYLAGLYPNSYENTAYYGLQYAEQLLNSHQKAQADQLLHSITGLPALVNAKLQSLTPEERQLWLNKPKLTTTPKLLLFVAEADVLQGKSETALPLLEKVASNKDLAHEALLWKGTVETLENDAQRTADLKASGASQQQITSYKQVLSRLLRA